MRTVRLAAALALVASGARAQVDLEAGLQPPTASVAALVPGDEGAAALNVNPGALGYARGLQLGFVHQGFFSNGEGGGNGVFGTLGAGGLTAGFGAQWLTARSCLYGSCLPEVSARHFTYGLGLQLGVLGVGATIDSASSSEVPAANRTGWNVGALLRPTRYLSVGASVFNADAPTVQGRLVPRRYQFGVGVRPLGERVTVGLDWRTRQCVPTSNDQTDYGCGASNGEWLLSGSVQVVEGLHLVGQATWYNRAAPSGFSGQLGLQLDFGHLGVRYAPRLYSGGGPRENAYSVRFTSEPFESIRLPRAHGALIDLDKALRRPRAELAALVFGSSRRDPLAETLQKLRELEQDPDVPVVAFRSGSLPLGHGRAEELRAGIAALRAAGKKVLFYLESGGDLEYSVAAAADRVYAAPQAVLLINGLSATALFAAAGLDKLGVKAEFFRVGAFKNAPDLFTRRSMSDEQREVENALLDDLYGRYIAQVAESRHLEAGRLKQLLEKGILSPQEAKDAGLLDGLLYPDQLEEEAGKLLGHEVSLEKAGIGTREVNQGRWGEPPHIAVVRVEGDILGGEGGSTPFGVEQVAGSDSIIRRIRRAADDPKVAAIVVRIDSPGGDGNASDLIWRELVRARKEKKKPVIASMGDVAASGGYYVAAGADEIWADPSTITGSIGVFVGHFDAAELWSKLGLDFVTMKRGRSADLFSPHRSLTDEERKTLQAWVEHFYDQFVERVAEARRLSPAEVDRVARGRVWTGQQALERGLVDHLGGLAQAIEVAKARARVRDDDARIDDEVNVAVELQDLAGVHALELLPAAVGAPAARALQRLGEPGTVRAALPFELEVR